MNFLSGFLALTLLLLACKSSESLIGIRVVEQSRQQKPAWAHNPAGSYGEPGPMLNFHLIKDRVFDLPLGLRQEEVAAVNDTKLLIASEQQQFWRKDPEYQRLDPVDRAAFNHFLQSLLDKRIDPSLIRDIYYEKLFDPTEPMALQETYSIHIHIQLPRSELETLLLDLRSYCRESQRQGLNKLAGIDGLFITYP